MRLLFAGTPEAAVPSLEALLASEHEVVAVVTQPARASGRGRNVEPSPVAIASAARGVPVLEFDDINAPAAIEQLEQLHVDAACVVAFGQLLKSATLALAPLGWVNLHFSLLPAYRGAAPVQRAVMSGETITGATTFLLDEGMDSGLVLGQLTAEIADDVTAGELLTRLATEGAGLLVATMDAMAAGVARPVAQPADGVSFAPKIHPQDGNLKWHHPALGIRRWIRGCTPTPGAWTTHQGARIGIGPVTFVTDAPALAPYEIHFGKNDVYVGTGSVSVRLGQVKPAGKSWMDAAAWARGLREPEPKFEYV